jgi:hypothetical protein
MKFVISYAYDVPHYADFVVDANNEKEALKKAKAAFLLGIFDTVSCQPDDSVFNERVFVHRVANRYDDNLPPIWP